MEPGGAWKRWAAPPGDGGEPSAAPTAAAAEVPPEEEDSDPEGLLELPCNPERQERWQDGLLGYRFRDRFEIWSDPRGVLVKGVGSSMWAAGEVMSDYLASVPQLCAGATCLELGAGLGGVGLTALEMGAQTVVLTDREDQMPLLKRNTEVNRPSDGREVHALPLDWTVQEHREGLEPWRGTWSLIVASDVGYDPDLLGPLVQTLIAQSSAETVLLIAIADRQEEGEPNVDDFLEAAEEAFECRLVHEEQKHVWQSVTKVLQLRRRSSK